MLPLNKNGTENRYNPEALLLRKQQKELYFGKSPVKPKVSAKPIEINPCDRCSHKNLDNGKLPYMSDYEYQSALDYCHYHCKA